MADGFLPQVSVQLECGGSISREQLTGVPQGLAAFARREPGRLFANRAGVLYDFAVGGMSDEKLGSGVTRSADRASSVACTLS